jgi:hypothetical protein
MDNGFESIFIIDDSHKNWQFIEQKTKTDRGNVYVYLIRRYIQKGDPIATALYVRTYVHMNLNVIMQKMCEQFGEKKGKKISKEKHWKPISH